MNIVALDTSTEACSVALQTRDGVLHDHRIVKREHAALVLPMLNALMLEAGITPDAINGVVFGQGPGSFTGLRIAAAAAQGLAVATDCKVLGVSSLQAVAARGALIASNEQLPGFDESAFILAAIDARMEQIYAASCPVLLCGNGAERYFSELANILHERSSRKVLLQASIYPHATELLKLANMSPASSWVAPELAQPVYLRNKVAFTEAERAGH